MMNIGKLALPALTGTLGGILLGWAWYPGEFLSRSVLETAATCGALAVALEVILYLLETD